MEQTTLTAVASVMMIELLDDDEELGQAKRRRGKTRRDNNKNTDTQPKRSGSYKETYIRIISQTNRCTCCKELRFD